MKDTMILNDGTVIELETGASLRDIRVVAPDRAAMAAIWAKLTPENLAVVQVKNGPGWWRGTIRTWCWMTRHPRWPPMALC